jgi:hypothetical protein
MKASRTNTWKPYQEREGKDTISPKRLKNPNVKYNLFYGSDLCGSWWLVRGVSLQVRLVQVACPAIR